MTTEVIEEIPGFNNVRSMQIFTDFYLNFPVSLAVNPKNLNFSNVSCTSQKGNKLKLFIGFEFF